MAQPPPVSLRDYTAAMAQSRVIVFLWSHNAAQDPATAVRQALAVQTGRPIRVLLTDDTRLPEDAFGGCEDLQSARVQSATEAARQVEAWLREVPHA